MKNTKQIITLGLCTMLSFGLIGCSNKKEVTSEKSTSNKATIIKKDIPAGLNKETGEGSILLSTSGGTSENGNTPVEFAEKDLTLSQIGLDSERFDGSKLSYIYIDGMLNTKEQLGEMTQTSLTLENDALKEGTHKVEVVQYENDESTGNAITYKTASYEIKAK